MDVDDRWTGRSACLLQAALRMSNGAFARHLGIALRTVAAWHQVPERTPNTEMQQLLTTALEKATPAARARFTSALHSDRDASSAEVAPATGQPDFPRALTVAIAIVREESRVLLVQRRGHDGEEDAWQFPAGMVKPGLTVSTVAVRETFAETGIHCAVNRTLGRRVHPVTNVMCEYVLCDYLSGEFENRDAGENVSVTWAATSRLSRFIELKRIYPPVLAALEVHA